MSFLARFEATCGLCDETIHRDDEVEYVEGVLCHSACAAIEGYTEEGE